jgi:hypothetical protein
MKRALSGTDRQAQLGDARRIVEPLVRQLQDRPRDAGTIVQRLNDLAILAAAGVVRQDLEAGDFELVE